MLSKCLEVIYKYSFIKLRQINQLCDLKNTKRKFKLHGYKVLEQSNTCLSKKKKKKDLWGQTILSNFPQRVVSKIFKRKKRSNVNAKSSVKKFAMIEKVK